MDKPGKITVGLSGGVDSAVAALLLQQQGWQVQGLFMKNWEEDDTANHCGASADLAVAQAVAKHLNIELRTANFATEYWDQVFTYFLAEYKRGRTPNPDIMCNSVIKFRAFLDHALVQGAAAIATGHYANSATKDDQIYLLTAKDPNKDQTYFLHRLTQQQLALSYFPLGNFTKTKVREIAHQASLPNATRKDSTGICFIGERRFRDFLAKYLPPNPGPIKTPEGQLLGEHQGLMYYTMGQRQGLGIGGISGHKEAPWFVCAKDLPSNTLFVVPGREHHKLWSKILEADNWHWINTEHNLLTNAHLLAKTDYQARIRHRQPLQQCQIHHITSDHYQITFAKPQWSPAPGQAIVLYKDGICLGGGIILRTL